MSAFQALSSDYIQFYEVTPERVAALAYLAANELDAATYLSIGLPFPIGKIRYGIAKSYPHTPKDGFGAYGSSTVFTENFSQGKSGEIAGRLAEGVAKKNQVAMQRIGLVTAVNQSMLDFDSMACPSDCVRASQELTTHPVTFTNMKAPIWHADKIPLVDGGQTVPENKDLLLPAKLSPIVREYVFRISPQVDEKCNTQPEYVPDCYLMMDNGKPHPLVLLAWSIAQEMEILKKRFKFDKWEMPGAITNAKFNSLWTPLETLRHDVENQMRNKGIIKQAEPNEVLMMSNYSMHRTKRPPKRISIAIRSGFSALRVHSITREAFRLAA